MTDPMGPAFGICLAVAIGCAIYTAIFLLVATVIL